MQPLHRREEIFGTRYANRPRDAARTEYIGSPSPSTPSGAGILSLPTSSAAVGGQAQAVLYGTRSGGCLALWSGTKTLPNDIEGEQQNKNAAEIIAGLPF